VCTSPQLADIH